MTNVFPNGDWFAIRVSFGIRLSCVVISASPYA